MKKINLIDILKDDFDPNLLTMFEDAIISKVLYYKEIDKIVINLSIIKVLPFSLYRALLENLKAKFNNQNLLLIIIANTCDLDLGEITKYIMFFADHCYQGHNFKNVLPSINGNNINLLYSNQIDLDNAKKYLTYLEEFMNNVGINFSYELSLIEKKDNTDKEVIMPKTNKEDNQKIDKPKYVKKTKRQDYPIVKIHDLQEEIYHVKFEGIIFNIENNELKSGKTIQVLYVKDVDDACIVKRFENARLTKDEINSIKSGDRCLIYGDYRYDQFARESIFFAEEIEVLQKLEGVRDEAKIKRVEFHTHSNKSEMDGVCDVEELIQTAFDMGHTGIAITDHMVAQAFPKAQACVSKLLKANPNRHFKMVYGVEMNMVDEHLKIVRNANDNLLDDVEYCIFDLETTGLSCYFDHIIEFGAVVMKHGAIIDRKQMFIKPPCNIPQFIQEKTNITNQDVSNAKSFKDAANELIDFIKDRVLVAHNATFDYSFLNEELKRIGLEPLMNPVIDTLDLARAIHSTRRSYKLGNIARQYRITYDEEVAHRADYDAEVLADVFRVMLNDCGQKGCKTLNDLQNIQTDQAFVKVMKRHVNVLARNQAGLKDLFKLITISNTETLAIFGKANSKSSGDEFLAEPRILRETLNDYRQNLLIGSSCFNGEVFELASNRNQEELLKAIDFYDYIEIQPFENYRPLISSHSISDEERLKKVLTRIIDAANKMNKLIIASGDVHYATKEEKILRDIYIQTQGIGGVRHPLYIYDKTRRKNSVTPDQHFLTTDEMIKSFSWLDNPNQAYQYVVENTNKLLDEFELVKPVHDKLYPPTIEGSADKLTEVCYKTAHEVYGEELPEIVSARLKRELDSIIGNGYAVVYYISHLLVKKSNEDGYLVGSRGSVGSSFVATMSGITEVNPLIPHYRCPKCKHTEWIDDGSVSSGYDLPFKKCPVCNSDMIADGQSIPFETFLGFEGDKVPDIDLNFSSEYQDKAHAFTKTVFGEEYVYRAGTIGTVAQKTAFGYVTGYCEEMEIDNMSQAQRLRLANGCEGVKRTTGQHPGGIIVIPGDMDVYDFTPVQYPANNPDSAWKTTHFDFHDIHDNVLKFDILGHVDPTAMRLLQNISGIDPKSIPMNDPETMSIFGSIKALKADERVYNEITGAVGLPEFGTKFVRGILELTKPTTFSELVAISGLSHGTDVWNNNAKDLIESDLGLKLHDVIGCRDDIMIELIQYGLKPKDAFTIMESVRKGKGLKPEWIEIMKANNVPQWYIDSCLKIKYMFPKAHAVAYVIMAIRIAWFKVHYPHYYYVSFFSLRCDAYEIETMTKSIDVIKARMDDIQNRRNNRDIKNPVTKKELDIYNTLEVCLEMVARGYRLSNIDIDKSLATEFSVDPQDNHVIIPPFTIIDGLGENVAKSIVEARQVREFLSKEDLISRSQLSTTLCKKLELLHCLDHLQDKNQLSLF